MAGARVNVPTQVKPLIDKTVADQIAAVQARMQNDPTLEQNARAQWAKACRSGPPAGRRRDGLDARAVAGAQAHPRDRRAAASMLPP